MIPTEIQGTTRSAIELQSTESGQRTEWLKRRQTGIGGSDVAAILGLSKWKTPLDIYLAKTGDVSSEQTQAAYFGTILEDIVAKEFQKRTGMKVQKVNQQLSKNGWMHANLDRAVVNPVIAGNVRVQDEAKQAETGRMLTTDTILECKTSNAFAADVWGDTQEFEIVRGKVVTEHKIPLAYEAQVQWYMGITGASRCYVAVLIGGQDFRIYEVPRSEETIQALQEKCGIFWNDFVLKGVAPDPMTIEDAFKLWPRDTDGMIEATQEDSVAIGELINLDAKIKELNTQKDELKKQLIFRLKDAQGFTIQGQKVISYKAQSTTRCDTTRLKKESPETFMQFSKTIESRTFRLSA